MRSSVVKRFFFLVFILCRLAGSLQARTVGTGDVGVGLIIGNPTGLTSKWWTAGRRALDMAVGWDFSGKEDRMEDRAR